MLITKEVHIDSAHRVMNHKSKCRNFHSHSYRLEVWVDDKVITEKWISNEWMVIDFWDLKEVILEEIDSRYDHWVILHKDDPFRKCFEEMIEAWEQKKEKTHFVDFVPTAENLARHYFELMEPKLKEKGVAIKHVKVYETPTSAAIYTINDK